MGSVSNTYASTISFTDTLNLTVSRSYGSDIAANTYTWTQDYDIGSYITDADQITSATLTLVLMDIYGTASTFSFTITSAYGDTILDYGSDYLLSPGTTTTKVYEIDNDCYASLLDGTLLGSMYAKVSSSDKDNRFTLVSSTLTIEYNEATTSIPEPSGMMLLGTGLLCTAGLRKRFFKR